MTGVVTASFSSAWLAGDARAQSLLPAHFRDAAARAAAVERAAKRRIDADILDVISAQNAALAPSSARDDNVRALGDAATIVVVTGQQVGLFLGPLYTVYKAASAIVCARALERETGKRCVPIFWLQTEDHDLHEIDHVAVPRAAALPLTLSVRVSDDETRIPVAHLKLGPKVTEALAALRDELGAHPYASHLDRLAAAYTPEATFASAFAHVLSAVFADDGLVLINPRDATLAPHAAPVHERALRDAPRIATILRERHDAIERAGFEPQVRVRDDAALSFYADAIDGPRYRITGVTPEHLEALQREPMRFSTSALLRPLLQDTWLPTAMVVGGPAEMSYFAQLGPLYDHFDVPMPIPVPRARFRVLDDRARALLEKLALSADDIAGPRDAILARLARASTEHEAPDALARRLTGDIVAQLERLEDTMAALDPSLTKAVQRTREAVHDAVERLAGKYGRALAQRDQVTMDRLERVSWMLYPDGVPQERVHGLAYYACRFGDAFIRTVVDNVDPFAAAQKDLVV